jgi:hypothetical protein
MSQPTRAITFIEFGALISTIGPVGVDLSTDNYVFLPAGGYNPLPPPANWRGERKFPRLFSLVWRCFAQFAAGPRAGADS